jgi:hypothetical protein
MPRRLLAVAAGGWGASDYHSGIGFNSCTMYFDGPPYSCVCPWLAVGGLLFTAILLIWNINGGYCCVAVTARSQPMLRGGFFLLPL